MPPDPKPKKAPRRPPRRAGVDSTAAPPAGFRRRVYERTGPRCFMCGNHSPLPEASVGLYDPAHLIPAQMIRTEARSTPALADFVYDARVAVWACRSCHFGHDLVVAGKRITRADLERALDTWGEPLWPQLLQIADAMDRCLTPVGARFPFTAYVESTYR